MAPVLDQQALQVLTRGARGGAQRGGPGRGGRLPRHRPREPRPHLSQRLAESFAPHRLEQIVERVHLERLERIFVVGGHEHDRRRRLEQLQNLEAVQLGHLDVEQDQVRGQLADPFHRFEAVGAVGHDLDVRLLRQVLAQQRARRLFVVHHHRPDGTPFRRHAIPPLRCSRGRAA